MSSIRRYELAWKEYKYENGEREFVKVILRSYRDSYISASSITYGCSSMHKEETSCFPTSSEGDMKLNEFCMYMKLGAIGFTILDAIVGSRRRAHA